MVHIHAVKTFDVTSMSSLSVFGVENSKGNMKGWKKNLDLDLRLENIFESWIRHDYLREKV